MVGLLAEVGRVDSLDEVPAGHCREVHVDGELQLPGANLRVAVNTREPQPATFSSSLYELDALKNNTHVCACVRARV